MRGDRGLRAAPPLTEGVPRRRPGDEAGLAVLSLIWRRKRGSVCLCGRLGRLHRVTLVHV